MPDKADQDKRLRFNSIQIAEWLDDLTSRAQFGTAVAVAKAVGLSQTRGTQYCNLIKLPPEFLPRLKTLEGLTEYELRPIVATTPRYQARAIRQILSRSGLTA